MSDPTAAIRERPHFQIIYLLMAIFGVILIQDAWETWSETEQIPYSQFEDLLDAKEVTEVVVQGEVIRGKVKTPLAGGRTQFRTRVVSPDLAERLRSDGVKFSSESDSSWLALVLSWVLPAAVFVGIWVLLMQRMAGQTGPGGLMAIGKSRAKVYVETDTKVCFDDVAGVDEAKAELAEVVAFLRDPGSYGRLGARLPKGILLVGPPGTGKTLLARAVAGEAGTPFFSISGSEFVEMFVGVGAARVRDLFEQARSHAPCIIFIDELDALGKARNAAGGLGGHDEKEQTLNQLLVELDGFDPRSGIVLLAATNRPEILDPALLRAGRFDRQVLVDRPDRRGRADILRVHMRVIQAANDASAEEVAALTPGFTGAELANLVNEAALVATRRNATRVTIEDFTLAIERIVAGLEKKNRLLNPLEREVVAYHEMGHAIVAAALSGADPVHKVSIIPRGVGALGYTMQRPTEDRYLMTRAEMEAKLSVLQGGRAAERLVFEHYSTGAADDLGRASEIARSMVERYAMIPELGSVAYSRPSDTMLGANPFAPRLYSEATARELDLAVRELLDASFDRASEVLRINRPVLEASAKALLESETLEQEQLTSFFDQLERPAQHAVGASAAD